MSLGRRNTWLCLFLGDGATARTPEQLNVLADHRAALDELLRLPTTQFFRATRLPKTICDSTGYHQPYALRTSSRVRASSLPAKTQAGHKAPSADLLTDQPLLDTLVSGHLSSNSVMAASYPSVYANDDAALRMHRNRDCSTFTTATGLEHHGPSVSDAPPRTTETRLRC
jgi:hypothetical protein